MGSPTIDTSPGARVGAYRIQHRIAVGGMAEIFRAVGEDGTVAALKIPLPQYAEDAFYVRDFQHEARLMERLDHPNLIRVLEWGSHENTPFLAMELIDGVTLAEVLAGVRGEKLSPKISVAVVCDVLRALDYMHRASDAGGATLGIIHRDVTPQNVLVSRDGRIKLGDFGIARSNLRNNRTRTGLVRGKVRYLSPEQCTGSSVDQRSDIYCAGLILFEMLAGERFIDAADEIRALRLAESPVFRPPSVYNPQVSAELDNAVERALARFPEERFATASAFLNKLQSLLSTDAADERAAWKRIIAKPSAKKGKEAPAAESAGERSPVSTKALEVKTDPPRRTSFVWLALAGALLLAAVGFAYWSQNLFDGQDTLSVENRGSAVHGRSAGGDEAKKLQSAELVAEPVLKEQPLKGPGFEPAKDEEEGPAATVKKRRRATVKPQQEPPAPTTAVSVEDGKDSPSDPVETRGADQRAARVTSIRAVKEEMAKKGVRRRDLPAGVQRELVEIEKTAADNSGEPDEQMLSQIEAAVRDVQIDAEFCKIKLGRVDEALERSRASGRDIGAFRRTAGLALQDYMDGKYEQTNRRLNTILDAIK